MPIESLIREENKMERRLTTAEACFELCGGAFLSVYHSPNFKRPCISIYYESKYLPKNIGYINQKQFNEIFLSDNIKLIKDETNKYGAIKKIYAIENWVIEAARKEYLNRKKNEKETHTD
jgi:hypothetical protein